MVTQYPTEGFQQNATPTPAILLPHPMVAKFDP